MCKFQLKSLLQTSVEEFVSLFEPSNCHLMPIFRMALTFEDEKMEIYPTLQDLEADVHDIVNVITNTLQVRLFACTSHWGENYGTFLFGCEIDPQGVQTIDSWQGQATPSFVDVKVADRILDWAHNILKTTVCKNLEEPNKHFQHYGDFPKSSDFVSSPHSFFLSNYPDLFPVLYS